MIVLGRTTRAVAIVRRMVWCGTGCEEILEISVCSVAGVKETTSHIVLFQRRSGNGDQCVNGEGFGMFWHTEEGKPWISCDITCQKGRRLAVLRNFPNQADTVLRGFTEP